MSAPESSLPLSTRRRERRRVAAALLLLAHAAAGLAYVFMGAYQIDEGAFLYSGSLAVRGLAPYRDFLFHHPPVALYILGATGAAFGRTLVVGRLTSCALVWSALFIMIRLCLRRGGAAAAVFCALALGPNLQWIAETYQANSLAPTVFFLAAAWWFAARGRRVPGAYLAAAGLAALATGTRVAALPALPALWLYVWLDSPRPRRDVMAAAAVSVGALAAGFAAFYWLSGGRVWFDLYTYQRLLTPPMSPAEQAAWRRDWWAGLVRWQPLTDGLFALAAAWWGWRILRIGAPAGRAHRLGLGLAAGYAGMTLLHSLVPLPLPSHQMAALPLAAMAAALAAGRAWLRLGRAARGALGALTLAALAWQCATQEYTLDRTGGVYPPAEIRRAADAIRSVSKPGDFLIALDPILAYSSGRFLLPGMNLGDLSFLPGREADTETCLRYHFMNRSLLWTYILHRLAPVVCMPEDWLESMPERVRRELNQRYDVADCVPRFGPWRQPLWIYFYTGSPPPARDPTPELHNLEE